MMNFVFYRVVNNVRKGGNAYNLDVWRHFRAVLGLFSDHFRAIQVLGSLGGGGGGVTL